MQEPPRDAWYRKPDSILFHFYIVDMHGYSLCKMHEYEDTYPDENPTLDRTCNTCWSLHDKLYGPPYTHPEHYDQFNTSPEKKEQLSVLHGYRYPPKTYHPGIPGKKQLSLDNGSHTLQH